LKNINITAWEITNIQATKDFSVKYHLPVDHVYSSDDNALQITDNEKNDWHSFATLAVWLDYDKLQHSYGLSVHTVDQMLDQKLTSPEDKLEKEKEASMAKGKVTFHMY
jgi:hypothetical protein